SARRADRAPTSQHSRIRSEVRETSCERWVRKREDVGNTVLTAESRTAARRTSFPHPRSCAGGARPPPDSRHNRTDFEATTQEEGAGQTKNGRKRSPYCKGDSVRGMILHSNPSSSSDRKPCLRRPSRSRPTLAAPRRMSR